MWSLMFLSAWVSTQDRERISSMAAPLLHCVLYNDVPLCPKGQWDFFFLHNLLHREMDKKDDLSFRCLLKLLLEVTLCDNIQRHGFLMGAENICVGLVKGGAVVGAGCTFEHHCKSPLVTYTACGGNHERRWGFHWSLCSQQWAPKAVMCAPSAASFSSRPCSSASSVLWYCFFYLPFYSSFSPFLFLLFWLSLTGTQEFLHL